MSSIKIENLSRCYPINGKNFYALRDINAVFPKSKISVILGRSGAGKTTLLRLVAGLEKASSGNLENKNLTVSMVFQEPRLMPWLTVEDNIKFWGAKEVSCSALLDIVDLQAFKTLYPSQISGGMAQKTALARALFTKPAMLLMDEPLASLDYFSRREMQRLLLSLQKEQLFGVIFITHNVDEAVLLGDELFILQDGVLKQHIYNKASLEDRENTPYADALKKQILSLVE